MLQPVLSLSKGPARRIKRGKSAQVARGRLPAPDSRSPVLEGWLRGSRHQANLSSQDPPGCLSRAASFPPGLLLAPLVSEPSHFSCGLRLIRVFFRFNA
jgi:hypothetical protein